MTVVSLLRRGRVWNGECSEVRHFEIKCFEVEFTRDFFDNGDFMDVISRKVVGERVDSYDNASVIKTLAEFLSEFILLRCKAPLVFVIGCLIFNIRERFCEHVVFILRAHRIRVGSNNRGNASGI